MLEAKKGGRPTNKPSIEELDRMYANMAAGEIAKKFGVTEQTVRRWICNYRKEQKQVLKKKI